MQPLPLVKIRPLRSAMRWRPGAPACRSRRAPSGGSGDNVGGQDRRQFALLTGHGNIPRL
jgi:hypothetical protein